MNLQQRAERTLASVLKQAAGLVALRRLVPVPWTADVRVVSPLAIAALNAKYRHNSHPTDILSFESPPLFRKMGILGSLVICGSILKRQAQEHRHSEAHELRVLIVHGFLHLLGFDHEKSKAEAKKMQRWENKLLRGRGMIGRK